MRIFSTGVALAKFADAASYPTSVRTQRAKKKRVWPLRTQAQTRAMILEFVRAEWVSCMEVSAYLDRSKENTMRALTDLVDELVLEMTAEKRPGSSRPEYRFRMAPPGFIQPLYESAMDARPLAETWNGYTFAGQQGATPWQA